MDALRRTRTYQPVLTDVRSIAPTGWYGSPQFATVEKAQRMLNTVADSIAAKSTEILRQLDRLRGGVAEINTVGKVR
jgi:creatinine amidohydrolase